MNARKARSIVGCYLAVSLGFCLSTGCVAQKTRSSQGISAENEIEKAGQKSSKAIVSSDQVPQAVQQALQVKFPSVKPTEWKLKAGNLYEAEYIFKGTEITVMFDAMGKWLETESAINSARVPKAVSDSAAKEFKGYKVIETQSVERWDQQHLIYELHFESTKEVAKAQFSNEGVILNRSAKAKP
jgi:hypothetical protein